LIAFSPSPLPEIKRPTVRPHRVSAMVSTPIEGIELRSRQTTLVCDLMGLFKTAMDAFCTHHLQGLPCIFTNVCPSPIYPKHHQPFIACATSCGSARSAVRRSTDGLQKGGSQRLCDSAAAHPPGPARLYKRGSTIPRVTGRLTRTPDLGLADDAVRRVSASTTSQGHPRCRIQCRMSQTGATTLPSARSSSRSAQTWIIRWRCSKCVVRS
jgi:hypothetical protein